MNFKFKNASGGGSNVSSRKNRGAISLEYILVIVVVVLACLVGMKIFGGKIGETINNSKDAVVNTTDSVFNRLGGTASDDGAGSGGSGSTGGAEADGSVIINEANFPDATFRTYVVRFDTDGDGKLASDERNVVTEIDVGSWNITSLEGVEYFTALTELWCYENHLTTLDVSNNTALTVLTCSDNQLTNLDISNNTALKELNCLSNQLTTLDVSNNAALTALYCGNNQLTSLDVSKNTALTWLDCQENQLSTLDVSNNTALTCLDCSGNQLTTLDVSNNIHLGEDYGGLTVRENGITNLDLSNCPSLNSSNVYTRYQIIDGNYITPSITYAS